MESLPHKPFVIFYDCCVPRRQFQGILPAVVRFADHLFAKDLFSERVLRNDPELFDSVEKKRRSAYPDKLFCLFVTTDGQFKEQVKERPAFADTTMVIHISIPISSVDSSWEEAIVFASKLAEVYSRMRERAHRKNENAEKFKEFCRELLNRYFKTETA